MVSPRGNLALAMVAALLLARLPAASSAAAVDLTPDNYDSLTASGDWMIMVYAEWCGHCKRLKPHYEAAAKESLGATKFGKIDGSKYRSLSTRFGVNGFPSLFHISGQDGAVREAHVPHSKEGLLQFARGGWEKAEPMSAFASPNGPVKKAIFFGLKYGEKVMHLHEPLAEYVGLPPLFVLMAFGIVGMIVFAGLLIGCAVWIGSSSRTPIKRD